MILAAVHLLSKNPQPTMDDIREGLSGNLCRCTGYTQIFEAVAEAARRGARDMRSDPADYELVAPGKLAAAVSLLADEPERVASDRRRHGRDGAVRGGNTAGAKAVSIWNLPELRTIEVSPSEIRIGAGCTYTDLRRARSDRAANFRCWRAPRAGPAESRIRIAERSAAISSMRRRRPIPCPRCWLMMRS